MLVRVLVFSDCGATLVRGGEVCVAGDDANARTPAATAPPKELELRERITDCPDLVTALRAGGALEKPPVPAVGRGALRI